MLAPWYTAATVHHPERRRKHPNSQSFQAATGSGHVKAQGSESAERPRNGNLWHWFPLKAKALPIVRLSAAGMSLAFGPSFRDVSFLSVSAMRTQFLGALGETKECKPVVGPMAG